MRIIYTFLFAAFVFSTNLAVAEENPFKGGMQHSSVYISNKTLEAAIDDEKSAEKKKKNRVWNKYKSLAAGQTEEDETSIEGETDTAAKEVEAVKTEPREAEIGTEPAPARPNAMGVLLQKYQQNKEQRRDLKSISFPEPEELTPKSKDIAKTESEE